MLKLSELKISPWPWNVVSYGESTNSKVATHGDVEFANGESAFMKDGSVSLQKIADAHLISASPDMYKTEYDLVDVIERLMNGWSGTCDTPSQDEVVAALEAAKKALSKAAGEEVAR